MTNLHESFIEDMYRNNIILFGEYKLSSGLTSPYYIDLRRVYSIPTLFKNMATLYLEKLDTVDFDVVSGIETGSIPIASILAYLLDKPMIYVRRRRKDFGVGKMIEGFLNRGDDVIVVEDVITTGGSVGDAVETIRSMGGKVRYALAFVDRMQGAYNLLKNMGVTLLSIYRVVDIVNYLFKKGFLDRVRYDIVLKYIGR